MWVNFEPTPKLVHLNNQPLYMFYDEMDLVFIRCVRMNMKYTNMLCQIPMNAIHGFEKHHKIGTLNVQKIKQQVLKF